MSNHMLRLDNQVCFPLYAAARAIMQAYQPLLAKLGLTYPQYLVMMVLWEEDGVSVKALGEKLYLDSGTLTPLLKRLQESGLLRRDRAAHDERVVELRLPAEGKRLRKQAEEIPREVLCRIGVPLEKVLRLRDDVKVLFQHLKEANAKENP
ncbi:MAG TPA: MarR family transcriptional regulator [Polyangia bacterium]|nr:MarR family transcriptional regulator [Polyangia bacterium]